MNPEAVQSRLLTALPISGCCTSRQNSGGHRLGQTILSRMAPKAAAGIALNLALAFIIAWILVGYIRYAELSPSPPSFDGAMNLNTAMSFIQGRGYGFFYDVFFPFPAQTDGPFTLPAAILLRLGGVTPLTTQGVKPGLSRRNRRSLLPVVSNGDEFSHCRLCRYGRPADDAGTFGTFP